MNINHNQTDMYVAPGDCVIFKETLVEILLDIFATTHVNTNFIQLGVVLLW